MFMGLNATTITKRDMSMAPNAVTIMATAKDMTTKDMTIKVRRMAKTAIMATTMGAIANTITTMGAIAITAMIIIITTTIMNIAKVWSGRGSRRQVGRPANLSLE